MSNKNLLDEWKEKDLIDPEKALKDASTKEIRKNLESKSDAAKIHFSYKVLSKQYPDLEAQSSGDKMTVVATRLVKLLKRNQKYREELGMTGK